MHRQGARIVAVGRGDNVNALAREGVVPVVADVAQEASAELAVRTIGQFGRLDILVNNAGIIINRPVAEMSLEEWNQVLSVNATGAFLFSRAAMRPMMAAGSGAIVNIGSTPATRASPASPRGDNVNALAREGVVPVVADVAQEASAELAVQTAIGQFGRLDILVNNAGIIINRPVAEMSLEEWNQVLSVNATGAFLFSRAAMRPMMAAGSGAIVNIGSYACYQSFPGIAAYAASKGHWRN